MSGQPVVSNLAKAREGVGRGQQIVATGLGLQICAPNTLSRFEIISSNASRLKVRSVMTKPRKLDYQTFGSSAVPMPCGAQLTVSGALLLPSMLTRCVPAGRRPESVHQGQRSRPAGGAGAERWSAGGDLHGAHVGGLPHHAGAGPGAHPGLAFPRALPAAAAL